ncbi:MAG: tRNA adenosine(34) deaminase TadA [Clostridia bacterium]|nr:tRNA adenosine(34) deaminase TadA [Clostridia bacterium]
MTRQEIICSILEKFPPLAEQTPVADEYFMSCALELAKAGAAAGEVPVGAVLVKDGVILCADYNGREETGDATYHAETSVIRQGNAILGGWRLTGCTLYVTLEPCPMCAGAVWNSRISRVVYGAKDARAGAMGSVFNINSYPVNWKPEVCSGVMAEECRAVLQTFFAARRHPSA